MKIINLHRKAVAQVPSACITHAQFQNPEKKLRFLLQKSKYQRFCGKSAGNTWWAG